MQRCPHCDQVLEDGLLPICWHCGRDTQLAPENQMPAQSKPDASADSASHAAVLFDLDRLAAQLGLEPDPGRPAAASTPPLAPTFTPTPPVSPPMVAAAAAALAAGGRALDWRRYQLPILGLGGLGAVLVALSLIGRPNAATDQAAPTPTAVPPATVPGQVRAPAPVPPPAAPTPAATNVQIEEAPGWVIPRRIGYGSDGARMLTLQLAALRDVQVAQQHIRPVLAVRCLSRRTEVFVSLGTSAAIEAGDTNRVTIQFDDQTPTAQQWLRTDTYQELFAPDGLMLAQQLVLTSLLRFTFTPFSSRPVVAEFNVRGFDQHVVTVAKACGWPSPAGTSARKR